MGWPALHHVTPQLVSGFQPQFRLLHLPLTFAVLSFGWVLADKSAKLLSKRSVTTSAERAGGIYMHGYVGLGQGDLTLLPEWSIDTSSAPNFSTSSPSIGSVKKLLLG